MFRGRSDREAKKVESCDNTYITLPGPQQDVKSCTQSPTETQPYYTAMPPNDEPFPAPEQPPQDAWQHLQPKPSTEYLSMNRRNFSEEVRERAEVMAAANQGHSLTHEDAAAFPAGLVAT